MKTKFTTCLGISTLIAWCACSSTSSNQQKALNGADNSKTGTSSEIANLTDSAANKLTDDKIKCYGPDSEYSINIFKNVHIIKSEKDTDGFVVYYGFYSGSDTTQHTACLIDITMRTNWNVGDTMFYNSLFQNSMEDGLGCKIKNTEKVKYNNVAGTEFLIQMQEGAKWPNGCNFVTSINKKFYSVVLIAEDSLFDKYRPIYKTVMNSLKIYH